MNRYRVHLNSKDYEVNLLKRDSSLISFELNGKIYEVEVSPVLREQSKSPQRPVLSSTQTAAPKAKSNTPGAVIAPIPGIIVDILVKVGQNVTAGQNLAVLEAMKMENNITAHAAGTVKSIDVKKGQEVAAGIQLLTIQ